MSETNVETKAALNNTRRTMPVRLELLRDLRSHNHVGVPRKSSGYRRVKDEGGGLWVTFTDGTAFGLTENILTYHLNGKVLPHLVDVDKARYRNSDLGRKRTSDVEDGALDLAGLSLNSDTIPNSKMIRRKNEESL